MKVKLILNRFKGNSFFSEIVEMDARPMVGDIIFCYALWDRVFEKYGERWDEDSPYFRDMNIVKWVSYNVDLKLWCAGLDAKI